ncbi:FHA domain-containing protein, partial [Microbacterium sp. NEAU-LLC]
VTPAAAPVAPAPAPASPAAAPAAQTPAPAAPTASTPAAPTATPAGGAVVVPPPGGWTPPPLPGRPVSAAAAEAAIDGLPAESAAVADASGDGDPWQGFALDTTDHSAEVTGAFTGAPAPISAVPASGPEGVPAVPTAYEIPPEAYAPRPSTQTPGEGITRPPVTDVPLPAITGEDREPWAPAHSPMAESEAFPEASGPVSAGVIDAGIPFSARSSVSAQHGRPELPDDDDDSFDETVIARRKRTEWTLVPPTGDPVALTADVVILGRRPSADAEHPGAQLVSIHDGTVSKTHARLQLRDDRWYVVDLDSTNGVLFSTVMGTEVEATPGEEVEAGERFLLGDAEIRLQRSDV